MLQRKNAGNKMLVMLGGILLAGMLSGCCLKHEWRPATCEAPAICEKCGKEGELPLGHEWVEATCTEAKVCKVCLKKEGEALGHEWAEATCTEPETCKRCGETRGEALGHEMTETTCKEASYCTRCSYKEGNPLVHVWLDSNPLKCKVCGYALPQDSFEDGEIYYKGIHISVPADMQEKKTEYSETSFCVTGDGAAISLTVDRNRDFSMDQWVAAYGKAVGSIYEITSEEELSLNEKNFHVFHANYKDTNEGVCVLYVGDRVCVYMELMYTTGTSGVDDKVKEILNSLEEIS